MHYRELCVTLVFVQSEVIEGDAYAEITSIAAQVTSSGHCKIVVHLHGSKAISQF